MGIGTVAPILAQPGIIGQRRSSSIHSRSIAVRRSISESATSQRGVSILGSAGSAAHAHARSSTAACSASVPGVRARDVPGMLIWHSNAHRVSAAESKIAMCQRVMSPEIRDEFSLK